MDILDKYFGEQMQQYLPKYELGKIYTDAFAFTPPKDNNTTNIKPNKQDNINNAAK